MGATMTRSSSGVGLLLSSGSVAYRAQSTLVASWIAVSRTAFMSSCLLDCCVILALSRRRSCFCLPRNPYPSGSEAALEWVPGEEQQALLELFNRLRVRPGARRDRRRSPVRHPNL